MSDDRHPDECSCPMCDYVPAPAGRTRSDVYVGPILHDGTVCKDPEAGRTRCDCWCSSCDVDGIHANPDDLCRLCGQTIDNHEGHGDPDFPSWRRECLAPVRPR